MARTAAQLDALLMPYADGTTTLSAWSFTAAYEAGGVHYPDTASWSAAPYGTLSIEWWPDAGLIRVVSDEGGVNYDLPLDSVPGVIMQNWIAASEHGWQTGAARDVIECRTSDPSSPAPGQIWFRTDL